MPGSLGIGVHSQEGTPVPLAGDLAARSLLRRVRLHKQQRRQPLPVLLSHGSSQRISQLSQLVRTHGPIPDLRHDDHAFLLSTASTAVAASTSRRCRSSATAADGSDGRLKRGSAAGPDARVRFHGRLYVLRVVVAAAHDDEVFRPPADEELAVVDEAQVPRA